jgi:hypothetical protein
MDPSAAFASTLVLVLILFFVRRVDRYPGGGAVDEKIGDEAPLFADGVDGVAEGCVCEAGEYLVEDFCWEG